MDYYVFVTKSCNMKCRYCVFSDILNKKDFSNNGPDVNKVTKFILDNIKKNGHPNNKIVFYGGEPLLNQKWLLDFINLTEGKINYALQTNGTLLSKVDRKIIEKIDFLEISIDGIKDINDKFRGTGTFDLILKNIEAIKPFFKGRLVARMTYTPQNPLYESVKMLVDEMKFDDVYWMHEDYITPVKEWVRTNDLYSKELDNLINYWMKNLRNGIVKSIDPFKSIVYSMLSKKENLSFRCGFGTFLICIDSDGLCYNCDLMTEDKKNKIGDIENGITKNKLPKNILYEDKCKKCKYLKYCGGRCFHVSFISDERFFIFCERTKLLISKLEKVLPEILNLINQGIIKKEYIDIGESLTEEIP